MVTKPAIGQSGWGPVLNAALDDLQSQILTSKPWLNVLDFGAASDGGTPDPTDNTGPFQAAIDHAGQGGVVYIPPGQYRLGSPIVLTLGVTLRGAGWSPHFVPRTNMTTSYLRPGLGNLDGDELIRVDPAPVNGSYVDSAYGGGPRIEGLAFNGRSTLNADSQPITAIRITNGVKDVQVRHCSIWECTGDAIYADRGAGMIFDTVTASTNDGVGFNLISTSGTGGATDVDLIHCYAQANGGGGYILQNPNAVLMDGCRAEFNDEYGYRFTGTNSSTVIVGCNTDRNEKSGFQIECIDGGKPMILLGCQAKRDGSDGAARAGFNMVGVDSTTQNPGAILQGCSTYVGRADDGTGTRTPAYGIQTQFTRRASVAGGWIEGTSGPYNDLAVCLNRAAGITQVTVDAATGVQTISNSDRMTLMGATGATKAFQYYTRGSGQRWETRSNSTAESGSNAGSDFDIARFSDAGAEIDIPFRLTRSSGDARFLGNVLISTIGRGLRVAEGSNAKMGTATLTAGAVTVSTTAVTANSRIFLTAQSGTTNAGFLSVSTRTAGTSFAIASSNASDARTVAWMIVEPA
jgi:hypothetical protein